MITGYRHTGWVVRDLQRSRDSVQVVYCHDPDGIILELVEEKRHEP
jgi:hypothetical protein